MYVEGKLNVSNDAIFSNVLNPYQNWTGNLHLIRNILDLKGNNKFNGMNSDTLRNTYKSTDNKKVDIKTGGKW